MAITSLLIVSGVLCIAYNLYNIFCVHCQTFTSMLWSGTQQSYFVLWGSRFKSMQSD